jgi:hypothetical protein
MEDSKVAELSNKFLDLTFINKENKGSPFSLRAYTIRHFAESEDGSAIIADTMGGFIHVTMKYAELAELMAEYDRFIEVRMATFAEGGTVSLEKTQRCSMRVQNIVWYGSHVEGGATIIDCYGRTIRVATTYEEVKRLIEGM